MFCGWETFLDYNELVDLGSGKLEIDALTGMCSFNESPVDTLLIARALNKWLTRECQSNNIDIYLMLKVRLTVNLDFSKIAWKEREYSLGEHFFKDDKEIKPMEMHRCNFRCESLVQTDEKTYSSGYSRIREWPVGWPKKTKRMKRKIV